MNKFENQLQSAIENAEKELNSLEESPFSSAAFETLKEKIGRFISELVAESIKGANDMQQIPSLPTMWERRLIF
jgi:hypothetical protein